MEDFTAVETNITLVRTGEQKFCRKNLQSVLIVALLMVIAVITGILIIVYLTGTRGNSTLKPWQTEPPKVSSRLQTEKKTEHYTKPTTASTTKLHKGSKKKMVYGHLVPIKGQRKGKIMRWDLTPPSFLSPNGVRLNGNQTTIQFGVSGVYRFSISLSVYSGESHSQAFNNRIRLKTFVNNVPVPIREVESIATGTLSDSFIWQVRFRDSIRFQISDEYWSLHHTKTSFDFNLISD